VLQRGMQRLRVEQSALAGQDAPIGDSFRPASRRRQQRLFGECCTAQPVNVRDLFHFNLRAGGGRVGSGASATRTLPSGGPSLIAGSPVLSLVSLLERLVI